MHTAQACINAQATGHHKAQRAIPPKAGHPHAEGNPGSMHVCMHWCVHGSLHMNAVCRTCPEALRDAGSRLGVVDQVDILHARMHMHSGVGVHKHRVAHRANNLICMGCSATAALPVETEDSAVKSSPASISVAESSWSDATGMHICCSHD